MNCRACGVCCVAISISSSIPGMPNGKPAGVRCVNLTVDNKCAIFGREDRPAVCSSFPAMPDICGESPDEAMALIAKMEAETSPNAC